MLSALISGTIASDPKHGKSASGTVWSNCVVRVPCGQNREGEAESAFVTLAAFGSHAEALARLGKGDAVSATGAMKPTTYTKDGQERHGLSLTATAILSPYQIRKKRGDDQSSGQSKTTGKATDREQSRAYGDFAKRAMDRGDDGFADEQIPF